MNSCKCFTGKLDACQLEITDDNNGITKINCSEDTGDSCRDEIDTWASAYRTSLLANRSDCKEDSMNEIVQQAENSCSLGNTHDFILVVIKCSLFYL